MDKKENGNASEEDLVGIVGDDAIVALYYGGYEIEVKDPGKFPWARVFEWLLEYGYGIYIVKREERLRILAKQSW